MANTGYKQATIAYKVDAATGAPLDIYGQRTAVSGRRQAIRVLVGSENPDENQYEVEAQFNVGEFINGQATRRWAPLDCPSGEIFVNPARIAVAPESDPFFIEVNSSGPWSVTPSSGVVSFSQTAGDRGRTYVEITFGAAEGQQDFIFTNTQSLRTATLRVILSNDFDRWILATGFWDNMGFWINSETWNY